MLSPCPFCGFSASIDTVTWHHSGRWLVEILCERERCGALLRVWTGGATEGHARATAERRWNRRVHED